MREEFKRTELLLGSQAMERLAAARVAVFGIGGVGGYVCEALVRSGIGAFDLIDNDTISLTNLNRQIIATHRTVGRSKTEVMKERMLDINPRVQVRTRNCFFLPDNADAIPFDQYDYVVDAVDTVTAKLELICRAQSLGIPVISAMGTGNKLDPGKLKVTDLYQTSGCPLARIMRKEAKKRGILQLKVVYSEELPRKVSASETSAEALPPGRRSIPGSTAFVPAAAGLMMAAEIVRDLCQ